MNDPNNDPNNAMRKAQVALHLSDALFRIGCILLLLGLALPCICMALAALTPGGQ